MKYIARIGMNRATNSAVLTLVRSADSAPLLVDGEPVEVECNYEFVDKCLSLSYLDGLERRIKAIEEDQERLARIEARDALEYERLRAKFASREGAGGPRALAFSCHCANADDWYKGIVCPICGEGIKATNAAGEPKPGKLALTDVADAVLQDRGCRSIGFSHDARLGCRVVEVNMGPILGVTRIPFDGTETTAELAEKVRAALPNHWKGIV